MKSLIRKNLKPESDHDKGFTLIEVLVSAIIMAIVVALAGTGFVGILKQNRKAELQSERRTNLNRALEYVANEIRMAKTVTPARVNPAPTPSTTVSSGTGVMRLTIPVPNPEDGSVYNPRFYTVVYYSADSWTGWDEPNSVWRYSNISNPVPVATSVSNPIPSSHTATLAVPAPSPTSSATVDHNFLVDGIQDPPAADIPDTTTDCPSTVGTLMGSNGFYACIHNGGNKVDLYLYGRLSDQTDETMEVKTTVFTRSN